MSLNNSVTTDDTIIVNADSAAKIVHDQLLAQMPEGADHPTDCPLCIESPGGEETAQGGVMATYSEDEFKSAVATAVAEATSPLTSRIAELETSHEEAELQTKIEEVKTPLEAQVTELQSQLDAATVEATTAKEELATTLSYFEDLAKAETEKAEFETLRDARVAQVREVASFPEEYIEANAARWAGLDDEAFSAALEDWKLIAEKASAPGEKNEKTEKKDEKVPSETAMTATAETASTEKTEPSMALVSGIFDEMLRGFDPKTV